MGLKYENYYTILKLTGITKQQLCHTALITMINNRVDISYLCLWIAHLNNFDAIMMVASQWYDSDTDSRTNAVLLLFP